MRDWVVVTVNCVVIVLGWDVIQHSVELHNASADGETEAARTESAKVLMV